MLALCCALFGSCWPGSYATVPHVLLHPTCSCLMRRPPTCRPSLRRWARRPPPPPPPASTWTRWKRRSPPCRCRVCSVRSVHSCVASCKLRRHGAGTCCAALRHPGCTDAPHAAAAPSSRPATTHLDPHAFVPCLYLCALRPAARQGWAPHAQRGGHRRRLLLQPHGRRQPERAAGLPGCVAGHQRLAARGCSMRLLSHIRALLPGAEWACIQCWRALRPVILAGSSPANALLTCPGTSHHCLPRRQGRLVWRQPRLWRRRFRGDQEARGRGPRRGAAAVWQCQVDLLGRLPR